MILLSLIRNVMLTQFILGNIVLYFLPKAKRLHSGYGNAVCNHWCILKKLCFFWAHKVSTWQQEKYIWIKEELWNTTTCFEIPSHSSYVVLFNIKAKVMQTSLFGKLIIDSKEVGSFVFSASRIDSGQCVGKQRID